MASGLAWGKEAILRRMAEEQKSYFQSYIDYMNPRPGERTFIESYIASTKQSTEQKGKKSQELDKWLENVLVAVFVVGAVLFGLAGVAIAVAGLLFTFLALVIGVFAVSGMFKDE